MIKKLTLGVRTGVVNSGECRGRIRRGGDDGNESMMAATGVEQRTKAHGGQQQWAMDSSVLWQTAADERNGSGWRQMSADGGKRRRRFDGGWWWWWWYRGGIKFIV